MNVPDAAAPDATAGRSGTRRMAARWLRRLLVVVLALTAATAAVVATGGVQHQIGPVTARLSLVASSQGGTEVHLAPVGQLRMDTHSGPLALRVSVEDVRLDQAQAMLLRGASGPQLARELRADISDALWELALRSALVGLLAAALVCAVVFRGARAVVAGTTAALMAMAAVGLTAAGTARPQALAQPTFTGLLAQAPQLIGGVRNARAAFDAYSERLVELTSNVTHLYGRLQALPTGAGAGSTRILWVSDVHNNPQAYSLMQSLIAQYGVAAVVDTGDSTDLGTAVENQLHADIADLPVPYLWVRGNHDSLGTTQAHMETLPNVEVLDEGESTEVAGLRFAGIGCPVHTPAKQGPEEVELDRGQLLRAGAALAQAVERSAEPVDVALVHDPVMARPLFGKVPLVLDGHTHERAARSADGTLELTQGSSGGAGLRALDGGATRPLQMSVLHFDPETRELVAVDDITVGGIGEQRVTVERTQAASYAQDASYVQDASGAQDGRAASARGGEQPGAAPVEPAVTAG